MTSRPQLYRGGKVYGVLALALFAVLAAVFLTADFGDPAGFPTDQSIVANIGYAMFDMHELASIPAEGFLVAFLLIAVVLDAALDASLMLAKRNEDTNDVMTDGGSHSGGGPRTGDETADEGRPGGEN